MAVNRIGFPLLLVALTGLIGCGPDREAQPKDRVTEEWARDFTGLNETGLTFGTPRSATPEAGWGGLDDVHRRILGLASGEIPESTAELEALVSDLHRGLERSAARGEVSREAAYRIGLAVVYQRMGFLDAAMESLEAVMSLSDQGLRPAWDCVAYLLRGDVLVNDGNLVAAVGAYRDAVRFCGERDQWRRAREAQGRIHSLCLSPTFRPAMEKLVSPLGALARENATAAISEYCRALLVKEARPEVSFSALERAERLFTPAQRVWFAIVLEQKGMWHLESGEVGYAVGTLDRLAGLQQELSDEEGLLNTYLRYGVALDQRGDPGDHETAAGKYRSAYHLARQLGLPYEEAVALSYLGLSYRRERQAHLAAACLIRAASLAAEIAPGSPLEANVRGNLSVLAGQMGGGESFRRFEAEITRDLDSVLVTATKS